MTKTCTKCQETKSVDEFSVRKNRRPGSRVSRCRSCISEDNAAKYQRRIAADPTYARRVSIASSAARYGITPEDYDRMYESQGGLCAICRGPEGKNQRRFHIDHCHETGKVRGLLCFTCNIGLGGLRDDIDLVFAAAAYLLEHDTQLEEVCA